MSKPVLGIIGGGQLGSMLAMAAKKLEVKTIIFCDDIMHLLKNIQVDLFVESMIIKKKLINL